MKKVILLFVAVMISSVLWAQNQYGDATVVQDGNYNKSMVDQTGATGGGWYYQGIGSGTDASVSVTGDYNQTYIKQVGNHNVAGQDIQGVSVNPCKGFDAFNQGGTFTQRVTVYFDPCKDRIQLACCRTIPLETYRLDLPAILPGIYISGDENIASISQEGDYLLAGIQVVGDGNKAGIKQKGDYHVASLNIEGNDNHVIIKQLKKNTENNLAMTYVKGDGNSVGAMQETSNNSLGQKVVGDNNMVFAKQTGGNWNYAIQDVAGDNNAVLLLQDGRHNKSVQVTSGSMHNSWVQQMGNENRSVVLQ